MVGALALWGLLCSAEGWDAGEGAWLSAALGGVAVVQSGSPAADSGLMSGIPAVSAAEIACIIGNGHRFGWYGLGAGSGRVLAGGACAICCSVAEITPSFMGSGF